MQTLGEWDTQAELFTIVTLLKINIFIFTWESHSKLYHWLCYKPITTHRCAVNRFSSSVYKVWNLTPPANYQPELHTIFNPILIKLHHLILHSLQ